MKIIWTKSLIQGWFDMLSEYTNAELNYSIIMDYDRMKGKTDVQKRIFYFPVRRFNHIDVDDALTILYLTYFFGIFSDLHLPLQQHMLSHTEEVIWDICDHFNVLYLSKEDFDVQMMKTDRLLLNDLEATDYHVGSRLIKKFSVLMYTVTNVGSLINDRRNITISSEYETLVLDEEDIIRNYHTMANLQES